MIRTVGLPHIINLLEHYDLPTIKTLLHIVPCKITWKREVKLAVDKLWNQKLISDCSQKSSLAFCETAILSIESGPQFKTTQKMSAVGELRLDC